MLSLFLFLLLLVVMVVIQYAPWCVLSEFLPAWECLSPAYLKDTLVSYKCLGSHFLSLSTFCFALLFSLHCVLYANLCFYCVHSTFVPSIGAFIPVMFVFLIFIWWCFIVFLSVPSCFVLCVSKGFKFSWFIFWPQETYGFSMQIQLFTNLIYSV